MSRNIPPIFAISTLVMLILCSACVSLPTGDQKPQQNGGLTQVIKPVEPSRISFEEAKAKLIEYRLNSLNEAVNAKTVYYMRSRDVDESGNATGWIFGVLRGSEAEFLVYDRTGWTTLGNATLSSEEIDLDNIVSTDFLFKQNNEIILGNPSPVIPERRDIELQRGIYKITITSGSTNRILTFNATTGALIT